MRVRRRTRCRWRSLSSVTTRLILFHDREERSAPSRSPDSQVASRATYSFRLAQLRTENVLENPRWNSVFHWNLFVREKLQQRQQGGFENPEPCLRPRPECQCRWLGLEAVARKI